MENDDFDPEDSSGDGDIDDFKYDLNLEERGKFESGYYDFNSIKFEVDKDGYIPNSTIEYSEDQ